MKYRTVKTNFLSLACALAVSAASLIGCASNPPPPTQHIAAGRAALEQAQRAAGGETVALESIASAQRKLESANLAMQRGDHQIAQDLAEQAEADAQLALAQAGARKTEAAANELRDSIRTLQSELSRQTQ